ncbi:MAG TPA: threo-3-hydroxy-L-aspartate ammonia-lyase [Burkholderiales bacterium]
MSVSPETGAPVRVTFDDVRAAAARLKQVAHRTPVLTSASVDQRVGARVFFKCENFQRAGAFKFRGAFNATASAAERQKLAGVITFSSGNHGQALALAARLHGVAATIVMPNDAPANKIAATRDYGGHIVFYERTKEDREALARRVALERSLVLIPPYDHPDIVAGQGTAAMELFEEIGELDYLLVPLGGGGLLAGSALASQALSRRCKVVGVEPDNGNDGQQSLRLGRIVTIPVPDTIADGARTTHVGRITFAIMRDHVSDILTVGDRDLIETMRYLAERMKIVVEPTGALGAAAVLRGGASLPLQGRKIGVLVSGGNVDIDRFAQFVSKIARG